MRSLATVGRQIEQLVRQRAQQRQVILAAGHRDLVDWGEVARLEAEGVEVVIVTTGIERGPLDPPADDAAKPSLALLSPPWSPDHATTPKPGKSECYNSFDALYTSIKMFTASL
jgi:hypothetical protein